MALTADERVSIKHHLGYPNTSMIESMVLGVPQALESLFILEGALSAVSPQSEERVRQTIKRLDGIDDQLQENQDALVLKRADEVEFRDDEFEKCLQRYRYWQGQLCNLLAVPCPNPFDARFMGGGAGSVNISVSH